MSHTDNSLASEPEHDLLPPNATSLERGLSISTARIGEIPLEMLDIWHPDRCPRDFLPCLAWAMSLVIWQEQWHEGVRRTLVSQAVQMQKGKGTREAIKEAVRRALALTIDPRRENLNGIDRLDATFVIREWWEQPEGDSKRRPFSFEVRLLTGSLLSMAGVLEAKLYRDLRRAVDAVKPVTSRYTLTVGALQLKAEKGIGSMARAVHMARFTVNLDTPSLLLGEA